MQQISKNIRSSSQHLPVAGRRRSIKRPTQATATKPVGCGFLTSTFHPLIQQGWKYYNLQQKVHTSFYSSLANLYQCHQMPLPEPSPQPYPMNIQADLKKAIDTFENDSFDIVIVKNANGMPCIAIKQECAPKYNLYYISIQPVAELLNTPSTKPSGLLSLSVLSWLCRKINIDFYSEEQSYLYDYITRIEEHTIETEEELEDHEDFSTCMEDIKLTRQQGDLFYKQLIHPKQIALWNKRIKAYKPTCDWEIELLTICKRAYQIFKTYPDRTLLDNVEQIDTESSEYDDTIFLYQYIGFIWNDTGWLGSQLIEWIQVSQQEQQQQYPLSYQLFDQPQHSINLAIEFERQVFAVIEDIAYHLTHRP